MGSAFYPMTESLKNGSVEEKMLLYREKGCGDLFLLHRTILLESGFPRMTKWCQT